MPYDVILSDVYFFLLANFFLPIYFNFSRSPTDTDDKEPRFKFKDENEKYVALD